MHRTLVSLGSNLGDSEAALDRAVEGLKRLASNGLLRVSPRCVTIPVGGPPGQRPFLNAAATFQSKLRPEALLAELQAIEESLDRQRHERWAARTLDLDLLLYGDLILDAPELRVPHPRMTFRPFVLGPAAAIAGDWVHPECGQTLAEIDACLRAESSVLRLIGDDGTVRRWVVEEAGGDLQIVDDMAGPATRPRLTIDARPDAPARGFTGPRLALADCPPEHWRDEVQAALRCVWPDKP